MAHTKSTKSKLTGMPASAPKPAPMQSPTPANRGMGAKMDDDRRYKAQDALSTLARAEAHKKDKRLMADVKQMAKQKMAEMACIASGKNKR